MLTFADPSCCEIEISNQIKTVKVSLEVRHSCTKKQRVSDLNKGEKALPAELD
jgi:hypothetical protein